MSRAVSRDRLQLQFKHITVCRDNQANSQLQCQLVELTSGEWAPKLVDKRETL